MTIRAWGDRTWPELGELADREPIAILPVGAVEAHGPHLPLATDGIIAEAMAGAAAARLGEQGHAALVLPTLPYTTAPFAAAFPGTLSLAPETVTALVVDLAAALAAQRVGLLAIANAHLDPAHLAALHAAVSEIERRALLRVAFPDLTRRPWALRLGEEFQSGACHAGRFEGSVVLATRPELVREAIRQGLPENPASLSAAIRAGRRTFADAGGPQAYFGAPASASAEEGRRTVAALAEILCEAVEAALAAGR